MTSYARLGVGALASVAALATVSCSSTASSTETDAGGDAPQTHHAGKDATPDSPSRHDAGRDGGHSHDGGSAHDTGVDGGAHVVDTGVDGGGDARVVDTGVDAAIACNAIIDSYDASPGSFDPSFNSVVEPATTASARTILEDPSGLIYVVGGKDNCVSATSGADFAVTRFLADGNIDTTYGVGGGDVDGGIVASGGTVCIDFVGGADFLGGAAFDPSNGNLVLAGMATAAPATPSESAAAYYYTARLAVARLLPSGLPDTSFNGTGKNRVTAGPPEAQWALGVAVGTLGDIYAVGTTQALPVPAAGSTTANYNQLAGFVAKIENDGELSSLWPNAASGGIIADDGLTALFGATVSEGVVYVVGADKGPTSDGGTTELNRRFVTRAYNASTGALDTSFNSTGEVRTSPGLDDYAITVTIDPQQRVVVGGLASVGQPDAGGGGYTAGIYGPGYGTVVRYTPGGALDRTFNDGGIYVSPTVKGFPAYEASMLALQCDGKILLGALVGTNPITTGHQSLAVLRLTGAGQADPTYSQGDAGAGVASLSLTYDTNVNSILVDPQQRALAVSGGNAGDGPVLTRFLP
jgi:uncharacterized delta-60 repeat protein